MEQEILLKIENDIIDTIAILEVIKDACIATQQTSLETTLNVVIQKQSEILEEISEVC